MTGVLGREALEAVAIVALTTAALSAGRGDDRSDYAPRTRRRAVSPLAVSLALGTVAILAAVGVVVVFGGARRSAAPTKPEVPRGLGVAPWPTDAVSLPARLEALRVPAVRASPSATSSPRAPRGRRRRVTGRSAQPTRSRSPERPSSPAQFAQQ